MTTKKAAAKKSPAKKSATTKRAAKTSAKKTPAKAPAKKTATKKTATKQVPAKKTARKYSPGVGKTVEREMKEMKQGKLRSGRGGKKVTNPKQAIAIALSEARKEGKEVPPNPNE